MNRTRYPYAIAARATMLLMAVSVTACGARYIRSEPIDVALRAWPPDSISRNVVVVSVDGLRPDAIEMYGAPTLRRLMREGSFTLAARTINPSTTLPSHTSMLTGLPPERHGVLWNNVATADADSIEMPNIFSLARAKGYSTAAFFSKAKFQPLQLHGTLDYSQAPGGWWGRWSSARTVADVARYLIDAQPNVLFVHLTDPDAAGHRAGWMTSDYGRAILAADTAVNTLLGLADDAYGAGNYSVIVTADHGGHDTGHGSDDPRDVTIPWIAWGQGVRAGALDASVEVQTMDTAATVLWLLGLQKPTDWAGEAIVQAFQTPAVVATD